MTAFRFAHAFCLVHTTYHFVALHGICCHLNCTPSGSLQLYCCYVPRVRSLQAHTFVIRRPIFLPRCTKPCRVARALSHCIRDPDSPPLRFAPPLYTYGIANPFLLFVTPVSFATGFSFSFLTVTVCWARSCRFLSIVPCVLCIFYVHSERVR